MGFRHARTAALIASMCGVALSAAAQPPREVAANDNRRPAGTFANGVLTVTLVAGPGVWRPEAADGPAVEVAAFGEDGGPLLTPGPLLRAHEGTTLVVRVRNALADALSVHGFVTHPASEDAALVVPPGATREVRFSAGAPGTYHYWATLGPSTLNGRKAFESQLGGAFIVDPPGDAPADRVFVLTEWDDSPRRVDELVTPEVRRVFAINGFSWPHTERLHERVGQDVRWRIVNLTQALHPMHLHGFYFTVQSSGSGLQDTLYQPDAYRRVVTENMTVGRTMLMAWTPERPGNWLLHCHFVSHVTPALRFWLPSDESAGSHVHGAHDAATAMAGLVIGIDVTGDAAPAPPLNAIPPRRLTLSMQTLAGHWRPEDAFGFALASSDGEASVQTATVPGPLLVLHRGEPVEITLQNELPEATAIHWHGIELDSFYDGVPGWSGSGASTTPAIEPGGTFPVRFTPPRAGTFIYHTHSHDLRQLASGLYGAIVVFEPGETFDPARDHVLLLGMEGAKNTQSYDRFPVVVNGDRQTRLTFKAGVPNRLRLINITTNFGGLNVLVINANQPITWRPVAKDGAELPANQQVVRPALRQQVAVGETYDFMVDPRVAGQTLIEVRRAGGEWVQQVPVRVVP
jgi:FtsP/CotA-like multicopper oxidase with cupredoxin domain